MSQDIHDIIRMNVRLPERAMGDLRAQITAIKTGERRFLELLDRYGQKPVLDCIDVLMDHAEAAARERTRAIPDGVYEHFQNGIGMRGKKVHDTWSAQFDAYKKKYAVLADEISRMERRERISRSAVSQS